MYRSLVAMMAKRAAFSDNFNDGAQDLAKWVKTFSVFAGHNAGVTVVESGGVLTIQPISSVSSAYNGYEAVNAYNFPDGSLAHISVTPSGATQNNNEARFGLFVDAANYLTFAIYGNTPVITLRIRTAGVNSETTISYNSTTHKWVRFLRSGADILFQTAPDGATWTTRRTVTPSFSLAAVKPVIFAGTFSASVPSPISYAFDDFVTNLV
jgi:hypothetical protein